MEIVAQDLNFSCGRYFPVMICETVHAISTSVRTLNFNGHLCKCTDDELRQFESDQHREMYSCVFYKANESGRYTVVQYVVG